MIEVKRVLLARAIQRFETRGPTRYFPDLFQSLIMRFGFVDSPQRIDLSPSDPPKPIEFRHGRLFVGQNRRPVVIERLDLYNDGAVVDTTTSTDDADTFAEELMKWAADETLEIDLIPPRLYLSQVEFQTDSLGLQWAPALDTISQRLRELMTQYEIKAGSYSLSSINLQFDQLGYVGIAPSPFQLERRINVPYSQNVWFSQAPLKTRDHIALLKELDRL